MTTFFELARNLADMADEAGNDPEQLSEAELTAAGHALTCASHASTSFLVHRCNEDQERTRVEIARAIDLPPKVLRRRAKEAEDIVNLGGLPNIPQHAAHVALILSEIQMIGARLERMRAGSALN